MVVIRLAPGGKKHAQVYRIHVAESGAKLCGRFLEKLGTYRPGKTNAFFTLNEERFNFWLGRGAIPSERLKHVIKTHGAQSAKAEGAKPVAAEAAKK